MNIEKNYTINKVGIKHFFLVSILAIFDHLWSSSGVKITIVFYYYFLFWSLAPDTLRHMFCPRPLQVRLLRL